MNGECVKVRAGEIVFDDDDAPEPPPLPLPPAWPFAALRDLGAQLAAANAKLAKVRELAEGWRNYTPAGFYPEATAYANGIENCGDALIDLLDETP